MGLHDLAGDEKSESESLNVRVFGGADETIENMGAFPGVDARTLIADRNLDG